MPDLALAKQHLKVETADEDALIGVYLAAAVRWVENFTGTKLTREEVTQEEAALTTFVGLNWAPNPASLSIAYVDSDGTPQTLTDARLVRDRAYAPLDGWPETDDYNPVTLTYTAGFATEPADLAAAVLLLVGEYYANREAGAAAPAVAAGVESLCRPYRAVMV